LPKRTDKKVRGDFNEDNEIMPKKKRARKAFRTVIR
jgi:hypothetical protein